MDFFFAHDGHTYHLHTETGEAVCDQVDSDDPAPPSLESPGDNDE